MTIKHSLFLLLTFCGSTVFAQTNEGPAATEKKSTPTNWHQLDATEGGFQGISLDKAYKFLASKNIQSKKVVVAVIDSGIDTLHEDLKTVLWVNKNEIPGNNKDDDNNGYPDDVNGWNFLGGKDGRNVKEDSYEAARVYHSLKKKWSKYKGDGSGLSATKKAEYETFLRAKDKIAGESSQNEVEFMQKLLVKFERGDSALRQQLGKEKYSANDIKDITTNSTEAKNVKIYLINVAKANENMDMTNVEFLEELKGQINKSNAAENPPTPYRKEIVKDKESKFKDKKYGNNDVMAATPFHGTHCSGIIGAVRSNNAGIDGIADNVSIMMVRAVPDGDEHDKDIAYAIRYAVDNGARVISMSFGKDFSPQKKWVDDAFRYAENKGVLLVHAAGNDSKNIDTEYNFPNPVYADGSGRANNVITVGASGDPAIGGITASFSNFGKQEVDVFAPGVKIYSTVPGGNTYGNASGTSMACPVVAGIAALIMEYYPNLTAQEVKMIIERSAVTITDKVKIPGTKEETYLRELSRTGGIANAFNAIQMADEYSASKK